MDSLFTEFAPAERASAAQLESQVRRFSEGWNVAALLDLVPDMVMILNKCRQIVYANKATVRFVGVADQRSVLGLRPGELFGCRHAEEALGGCGTTRFCQFCGGVKTALQSQAGRAAVEECRMLVRDEDGERALDLRVWANQISVGEERFTFYTVVDIADEKRRSFLENIFLHDVMNTACALQAFSSLLLTGEDDSEAEHCAHQISALSEWLIEDIDAHKQLVAAENGELVAVFEPVSSARLLNEAITAYSKRELLNGRLISIADGSDDVEFETDATLLRRVLSNLVKNAVEGSVPGEMVTIGCEAGPNAVAFRVHNPTYIPENIRLQIFNRSFSTKGAGRGLGTYSVKFLTERYLNGKVSFASTESEGTTFTAEYPAGASTRRAPSRQQTAL